MHSAMSTSEVFLLALLIIFTLPYLVWRLGRTDYYAPLVVVQIIGGILLGPGVLGAAYPDYYRFVFNPQVIGALNASRGGQSCFSFGWRGSSSTLPKPGRTAAKRALQRRLGSARRCCWVRSQPYSS